MDSQPFHPLLLSRRSFLRGGLGAAGALGALALGLIEPAQAAGAQPDQPRELRDSLARSYAFLDTMMDAYAQGDTLRLSQSYADQQGLLSTGFVYDNALTIIAYLERRTRDDLRRAMLLGDSLLYAQQHDPVYSDGRLRQAYFVDQFVLPDGTVKLATDPFYFLGSAVGDMAWSALALARLSHYTREQRYLDGALRLANWIVTNTFTTNGPGGYRFGVDNANQPLNYKSSEHNIDVYGLFTSLARLTGDESWTSRAEHARAFILAMWNPAGGFFWTGTDPDGVTTNRYPIPEDVQSWAYLALRDARYAAALDWTSTNLATTDDPQAPNASFGGDLRFSGVTFSSASLVADPNVQPNPYTPKPDPRAVWFEGTAQMVAALLERGVRGDTELAGQYIDNIQLAQDALGRDQTVGGRPIPNNLGVVAASSVLDTGFGFSYFPNLHIGATAWYCIAAQGGNPFVLPRGRGRGGS